jgi:apolipoprotein D and lipocalin family protein
LVLPLSTYVDRAKAHPQKAPPMRSFRRRVIGSNMRRFIGIFVVFLVVTSCTGLPSNVKPVTSFEIDRYLGDWYEIARLDHSFERGLVNVTATYNLLDNGTVEVVNRGYDPELCKSTSATGTARFIGSSDIASLSVTFFWPFSGGYHVIALDQDDYQYALVSGPNKSYLWILARSPKLDPEVEERLLSFAEELDFPIADLINVSHDDPGCLLDNDSGE